VNTRLRYEHRDGANYRFHGEVVIAGEMTAGLWARIVNACDKDTEGGFIAHQVKLPEVFGYLPGPHIASSEHASTGYAYDPDNDHCWHHFVAETPWKLTTARANGRISVKYLVQAFEAAVRHGWRIFDPAERFNVDSNG
jgi:hypothetical protein